jgi:hypothetical protein
MVRSRAAALAIRQVVPTGVNLIGLQLGYFASYIFLFSLGTAVDPEDGKLLGVVMVGAKVLMTLKKRERAARSQSRRWSARDETSKGSRARQAIF